MGEVIMSAKLRRSKKKVEEIQNHSKKGVSLEIWFGFAALVLLVLLNPTNICSTNTRRHHLVVVPKVDVGAKTVINIQPYLNIFSSSKNSVWSVHHEPPTDAAQVIQFWRNALFVVHVPTRDE